MTTKGRKSELAYRKYRKQHKDDKTCVFCRIVPGHPEFIEEGKYFKLIVVLYSYQFWDEQDVEDQIMLVPKKHVESIRDLPLGAADEFLAYVGIYEEKGYSVYARAPGSATKSQPHQHTHLIKTKGKRKRLIIYSKKPFMLFMR
jgi:diadenosine tetraphosphate (Ap4A) HIT family hydrolase